MFVKIGSGIFDSADIRAIILNSDELVVHLKNTQDGEDSEFTVELNPSESSTLDKIIAYINIRPIA